MLACGYFHFAGTIAAASARFGRGYSQRNPCQMRFFYLGWEILQTPSVKFTARTVYPISLERVIVANNTALPDKSGILQTVSAKLSPPAWEIFFPLSWSHYVRLMREVLILSGCKR
jgi:hypothetical protein